MPDSLTIREQGRHIAEAYGRNGCITLLTDAITAHTEAACKTLLEAIREHHDQKADDRCWEDDDRLYAAAGLPPADRRVGDKEEMLANCKRFIERRCEGGGWPTYQSLMEENERLKDRLSKAGALAYDMNL